jgi:hypothetical protein
VHIRHPHIYIIVAIIIVIIITISLDGGKEVHQHAAATAIMAIQMSSNCNPKHIDFSIGHVGPAVV